jgi:hypothetical protein
MRYLAGVALGAVTSLVVLGGAPALAQSFNSGSTGADGAFAPTASTTVTLPASGVFNFTTINIPAGVTVRFTRNAANTPVTMLASGDVTIAGTIDISGAPGGAGVNATSFADTAGRGGPGGFDGGLGASGIASPTGGDGLGPGGGAGGAFVPGLSNPGGGGGGGFGSAGGNGNRGAPGGAVYGTPALLPAVGGSGGGGGSAGLGSTAGSGGGGGGSILIASSGPMTFTGSIFAGGGNGGGAPFGPGVGGGGSGGAVRLVATTITGSGGAIDVAGGQGAASPVSQGGAGGVGRVRIEAHDNTLAANFGAVAPSSAQPTSVTLTNEPSLRITAVAGAAAPAAPTGSFANPDITLPATTSNPVRVNLSAANIPPGTAVTVTVQGQTGGSSSATTTLTGTPASSLASADITIPTNQPSVISATASFTLTASTGGPIFVHGEPVERVRVSAALGSITRVTYITTSGREVVVAGAR